MAIQCPKCGQKHDVAYFEGGKPVRCRCGLKLNLSLIQTVDDFQRYFESEEEREKAREIQREAQVICQMILDERTDAVDIEIAKERLKEKICRYFPDKTETYQMIYESRFKRLWEQFRSGNP